MACDRLHDERLQAEKMDVLYGEAGPEARAAVEAHQAACVPCREEMAAFSKLRTVLGRWQPPARPRRFAALQRGLFVPGWLAAAAALLLGVGLGLGVAGYVSLRRALLEESMRAAAIEASQRQAGQVRPAVPGGPDRLDEPAFLGRVDARIDERVRASEARQRERLDLRFAEWTSRADAQRRVDLARVAEGLSYLDGRSAQQLARTNEMMGYVLASQKR